VSETHGSETLLVFPSSLGWFGVLAAGKIVRRLTFGRRSARGAARAIGPRPVAARPADWWQRSLVRRLQAYAEGMPMDFDDVLLDLGRLTTFERTVLGHCREIPYGRTLTYGQLAVVAGAPRAARAVGNCLAANPVPLLVPCHRVLPTTGGAGSYSAPGGTRMKQRLLAMESQNAACAGAPRG